MVGNLKIYFLEIYLKELGLKVKHQDNHACFLNLDIPVNNNIFVYKLFDKRHSHLQLVQMPHIDSSII